MPYEGEFANKTAHFDIVKNPDVASFLKECEYLREPSEEEGQQIGERFLKVPSLDGIGLPESVIAFDGSRHESSIHDKLPSTRIGYVKVSAVLIKMEEFNALREGRYVDPFRVARLQDNNSSLTMTVPSANVRWRGKASVAEGFRAAVDEYFAGPDTRFNVNEPASSLRKTFFHLAHRRPGVMATPDAGKLKIARCPNCGGGPIELSDRHDPQYCTFEGCGVELYPTDALRLWEEISDYQSNQTAITRLMLILEHLLAIHYIRYLVESGAYSALANTAFFIDSPLAIFGTAAWLHLSIMRYFAEINRQLEAKGYDPLLIVGLQKTGQLIDNVQLINRYVPAGSIFPVDDEYRYRYVFSGREQAGNGFGFETYYGQDFIYKTVSGRTFVFALPYPFASKSLGGTDFVDEKVRIGLYPQLAKALALINHFETDLYRDAVVPIALAHRYTAISLVPGGKVLDMLTRQGLAGA